MKIGKTKTQEKQLSKFIHKFIKYIKIKKSITRALRHGSQNTKEERNQIVS